jgi:hypothetical protein
MKNAYEIFVGKSEGKRPLDLARRRENNIEVCRKNRARGCGLDLCDSG